MAAKRVLIVDAAGLIALCETQSAMVLEAEFPASPEGISEFSRYVRGHRGSIFRLLTDLAEESYQTQTLPRLHGLDRADFLKRKRAQSFPQSPYCADQKLERRARQESVLLFGITRAATLDPWLDALEESEGLLGGIHTLAQAAALIIPAPRGLALLRTRSGLRQVFIDDGKLRFSRATPLAPEGATPWLEEADKTRHYLLRERVIDRNTPLPVWLLDDTPPPENLEGLECQMLVPGRVCTRLKLAHKPKAHLAASLAARALLRRPPAIQLAPPSRRRRHTLRRAGLALHGISAALALCLAITSLSNWWAREDFLAQRARLGPRNTSAIAAPTQDPSATTRALVLAFDQLEKNSPRPLDLLTPLSTALDHHPQIELERIEWQASPFGSNTPGAEQLVLHATLKTDTSPSPQQKIDIINAFTQQLERTPLTVKILSLPIETPITGKLTHLDSGAQSAAFSLHLAKAAP